MSKLIDLTGRTYGRLTVIRQIPNPHGHDRIKYWECICSCKTLSKVSGNNLKSGKVSSCGCLKLERILESRTKHGSSSRRFGKTGAYKTWMLIKTRCYNKNRDDYQYYGARGITVCDRWLESFEHFLEDMGERPSGHTIERLDFNKGYEKSNCVWATASQQANNKRNNVRISYLGQTKTASQWSRELGFSAGALAGRLRRGWEINDETMTPPCRIS